MNVVPERIPPELARAVLWSCAETFQPRALSQWSGMPSASESEGAGAELRVPKPELEML